MRAKKNSRNLSRFQYNGNASEKAFFSPNEKVTFFLGVIQLEIEKENSK